MTNKRPIEACYVALGARIRMMREALGLSREELATRLTRGRPSLTNVEAGRERVLLHGVEEFAKALGTAVADVIKAARVLNDRPGDVLVTLLRNIDEKLAALDAIRSKSDENS